MRICPECGKNFNGRSDKKFCSDECRAAFNDRLYRIRRKEIAQINRILGKNHFILKECFENGESVTNAMFLVGKGFNFEYFTNIRERCRDNGSVWIGCYSYSYTVDEDGSVRIRYDSSPENQSCSTL